MRSEAVIAAMVLGLDIAGVFVFALSGALAAVKRQLDLFGILFLAFAAASAGGILRDLLIGDIPPAAIADWRYLLTAVAAGAVTFRWYAVIDRLRDPVLLFDAAGLALFAVTGTQKALAFGLNPVMAALLGMLSGIGGGMVRDILVSEVPSVLRAELYAVAALAGAVVVVGGHLAAWPSPITMVVGAAMCFALRMVAIRYRIHLPRARLDR